MKINIHGRHRKISPEIERYGREKAEKLGQFFDRLQSVDVTLDMDGRNQIVEMSATLIRGVKLVGKATAEDLHAAIDLAESKLQRQIQKFHDRLKAHRDRTSAAGKPTPRGEAQETTYEQVVREMLEEGGD
ncbi:MAG: ribosome hibernation-promoting factor, HPF/YfiA family [Planctomycetaceae bacterium]